MSATVPDGGTKPVAVMENARTRALKVLVVDDQAHVLEAMRILLKSAGHIPAVAGSPRAMFELAEKEIFDLILLDMNYTRDTTSGTEGLHLLERLRHLPEAPPVIAMTAWGNIELAVEAMRAGASDFIEKPWDNNRLLALIGKVAASRRSWERGMEVARRVQSTLAPAQKGTAGGVEYRMASLAASAVGGDYADLLPHGGIVLADVSGKGVAGAMLAANLQAHFRLAGPEEGPSQVIRRVNRSFFQCTPPEHYATVFYGIFSGKRLRYANCGHLPPVLLRAATGEIELLEPSGWVVGLFENWQGDEREIDFNPGDTLLVFSDGVAEAGEESGKEVGYETILQVCRQSSGRSLDDLVEQLLEVVRTASTQGLSDDSTVLAVRPL